MLLFFFRSSLMHLDFECEFLTLVLLTNYYYSSTHWQQRPQQYIYRCNYKQPIIRKRNNVIWNIIIFSTCYTTIKPTKLALCTHITNPKIRLFRALKMIYENRHRIRSQRWFSLYFFLCPSQKLSFVLLLMKKNTGNNCTLCIHSIQSRSRLLPWNPLFLFL